MNTPASTAPASAAGFNQTPHESAGPIAARERIASLDVLRGVALLGILPMNIQAFSMISAAYMNPTAYGDFHGANYWVWFLCHLLADEKFMTIFSMLFGAGIFLMTSHIEAAGRKSAALHLSPHGLADSVWRAARLSALVRRHPGELRALRIAGVSLPQEHAAKV